MREKQKKGKNTKLAVLFILIVIFFGIISLVFKLTLIIKDSSFDGAHSYVLEVKENKASYLISFSPQSSSIAILTVDKQNEKNLSKTLGVPVDGVISTENVELSKKNINNFLIRNLFVLSRSNSKPTFFDIIGLIFFTGSVSSDSITEENVSVKMDDITKQQIISPLFLDQTIVSEKQRIEIVNATDTTGLGSRLAILLNNIGGNIVLVVSSGKTESKSKIEYNSNSYTLKRISSILNFPKMKNNSESIADIIITIGEDANNSPAF
jgi:hypothetical protein